MNQNIGVVIVEIIFAIGVVVALIQAGYYQTSAVIIPILTGIFGYMRGVAAGKQSTTGDVTPPEQASP
ncbi:MAG: hypothetical protein ABSG90_14140 [Dehalococcoidia bacterium]|jgi:hydrogenase/urease accessory protein HupE